jgi:hypothetical protein
MGKKRNNKAPNYKP